jgi:MFS family permease
MSSIRAGVAARQRYSLTSPFRRLARVHALMAAGDVAMVTTLAGSLFLSIKPEDGRAQVLKFLAISLAPFAVVAPLIGPVLDRIRGGRRLVVVGVAIIRALLALAMIGNLKSLVLFPLAFAQLVLQKTYAVSRAALVPTVVRDEAELVEANSRLGVISGVIGFLAVAPAGLAYLISPDLTAVVMAGWFVCAAYAAWQLPREVVAATRAERAEQRELRSIPIVLAASAMGLVRAAIGFLFFHLLFWLRDEGKSTAWFAAGVAMASVATMAGNVIGPHVRRLVREDRMLVGALGLVAAAGLSSALLGGVIAGLVLMAACNFAGGIGRLSFDALVQSGAPDANRGRAFAQFETRFQLAWVIGGLFPVVIHMPGAIGFLIVGLIGAFGGTTYVLGLWRLSTGRAVPDPLSRRARREVARRLNERRGTPTRGMPRPDPSDRMPDPRAGRPFAPPTRRSRDDTPLPPPSRSSRRPPPPPAR